MKQKRWHKLLKVSSFVIASFLLFSCFGCAKGETEKQHVRIEGSFAPMSLGDIVKESEYIAYGEVIEKGPVTTPEYASDHDYGKDVTVRVKKGLLNCEEGDTVVYWELGGEAPNGIVYEHPGLGNADIGDTILIFISEQKSQLTLPALIEDEDGNLSIYNIYLEEKEFTVPDDPYDSTILPMEEYMEKVEKVIQAQAESK